jgi:membrane associated rhomboid family serine protease
VVTGALIIVNLVVFLLVQPRGGTELVDLPGGGRAEIASDVRFTFEYAAIPCEITEERSLDVEEIALFLNFGIEGCEDTAGFPLFPDKRVWLAGITSLFLHANLLHLGSNMLFLWIFGNNIEDHVGAVRHLLFYLTAGIVALIAHIALQPDSAVPVIGASGAVAGVMGAYFVWFPRAPVATILLIFLRELPASVVLGIWFVSQFFTGADSGVAWAAHVGGFAFGAAAGLLVRASPALRRLVWREPWRRLSRGPWDPTGGMRTPRY